MIWHIKIIRSQCIGMSGMHWMHWNDSVHKKKGKRKKLGFNSNNRTRSEISHFKFNFIPNILEIFSNKVKLFYQVPSALIQRGPWAVRLHNRGMRWKVLTPVHSQCLLHNSSPATSILKVEIDMKATIFKVRKKERCFTNNFKVSNLIPFNLPLKLKGNKLQRFSQRKLKKCWNRLSEIVSALALSGKGIDEK